MEKYYKLLDVTCNSTTEEIREAYKKAIIKYHPDKNQGTKESEEKFREIVDAYQNITKEKNIMDNELQWLDNTLNFMDKLFSNIKRTKDITIPLKINLKDIYIGTIKKYNIQLARKCKQCKMTGHKDCKESKECKHCSKSNKMCHICNGLRLIIAPEDRCSLCLGLRLAFIDKTFNINIPKGFDISNPIIFKREGHETLDPYIIRGDIIFKLDLLDDDVFIKQGNDLIINQTISLNESLTGTKLYLLHLDETELEININQIIDPTKDYIIKNYGLPVLNSSDRGSLIIKFHIIYPSLSISDKTKLSDILPKKPLHKPSKLSYISISL